jgi:hypothetical protein
MTGPRDGSFTPFACLACCPGTGTGACPFRPPFVDPDGTPFAPGRVSIKSTGWSRGLDKPALPFAGTWPAKGSDWLMTVANYPQQTWASWLQSNGGL